MKKFLRILIGFLGILLLLVGLVVLGFKGFMFVKHTTFYMESEKGVSIPGLKDKFVPQGLSYDEASDTYFVSGYYQDNKTSSVYMVQNKTSKHIVMKKSNGEYCQDHFGGISVYKDYVYITGSEHDDTLEGKKYIYTYKLQDLINANNDGEVQALSETPVSTGTAYCYAYEDILYVGEFYYAGPYETQESHHLETPNGETNKAILLAYALGEDGSIAATPKAAISTTDMVQGMCINEEGNIYFSTSWGVNTSHIYKYNAIDYTNPEGTFKVGETDVPLWYLDNGDRIGEYKTDPMSEGMVYANGKVIVLNESATSKYIFGNLLRGKNLWILEF